MDEQMDACMMTAYTALAWSRDLRGKNGTMMYVTNSHDQCCEDGRKDLQI